MADALSLMLWSLAEYFNYTAVALIVLCSVLMTVFIIRLNGDHWGHYHNGIGQGIGPLAQQKDVAQFVNPFFLKISPSTTSSLSDGVTLQLSCLQPCVVYAFWGAAVNPVHSSLLKTGHDFVEEMHNGTLFNDHCWAVDKHRLEAAGKHQIVLRTPDEVSAERLGPAPRQCYPCVVVMAALDSSCIVDHTTIVAMIAALHLKDNQYRMESHIISQYAKMAGHAVYNLQPLFLASEMDEEGYSADAQASQQMARHCDKQQASETTGETHPNIETLASSDTRYCATRELSDCRNRHTSSETDQTQSFSGAEAESLENSQPFCGGSQQDSASSVSSHQRQAWTPKTVLPECIICQNQPLNCALLPCRHTCVCSMCFQKLDRCPMCRAHVSSFFLLRDEDDEEEDDELPSSADEEPARLDLYSRFERFNTQLNQYLGFE